MAKDKIVTLLEKADKELEYARRLSVKEPMYLSDRVEINGAIRTAQGLISSIKDLLPNKAVGNDSY
jgi:hypothetical protein